MLNPHDWRKKLLVALGEALGELPAEGGPPTTPTADDVSTQRTAAETVVERAAPAPGSCPECGGTLFQLIPNGKRCAACGHQDVAAGPGGPSRKDIASGNLPLRGMQMNPGSFNRALARIRYGSR